MSAVQAGGARAARDFWLGPADSIRLDSFRVLFGLTLLLYMGVWWQSATYWLTPAEFHLSSEAAGPYGPVAPLLPRWALPVFGLVFFAAMAAFVVGWRLGIATWVLLAMVVYVTYADPIAAFTLNRLYMAGLLLLALVPKGAYWSVEEPGHRRQSVWPMRVLQATLIAQYFTAGWCKLVFGDWLANPYVLWSQSQGWYMTDLASRLLHLLPPGAFAWMQYMALTFELAAPVLFTWRRLRPVAFAWGATFQIGTALIAGNLIYFSLQMLSFYVLFVDERTLHRVHDALRPLARRLRPAPPPAPAAEAAAD